jgi:hypothetical protein
MNARTKRLAIVASVLGLVLFAGWYLRMPGPKMANLSRPKLTLTYAEETPAPAAGSARFNRPGQDQGADQKSPARANVRNAKTVEERREAAKKRREEMMKRRRAAREARGEGTAEAPAAARGVGRINRQIPGRPGPGAVPDAAANANAAEEAPPDEILPDEIDQIPIPADEGELPADAGGEADIE